MTAKAKKLFSSGEVSGADVRSMVEERSSVKKKRHTGSTDFKFLNPEHDPQSSSTRAELEALRQSTVNKSPFKIERW